MSNLVDKFVDNALAEVGYTEGWNNDTKYGRWYGLNYQPYCDMYVSYVAAETGSEVADAVGCFAYCPSHVAWFKNRGQWHSRTSGYTASKGDIIFFTNGGGDADHVGIVTKVSGSTIYTVEGNTSSYGYNDNGQGVYEKSYSKSSSYVLGFGHWQDSVSDNNQNDNSEMIDMTLEYRNGSTEEKIYCDSEMTVQTGSLNPYETATCLGRTSDGAYIVLYNHDNCGCSKIGFAAYDGKTGI